MKKSVLPLSLGLLLAITACYFLCCQPTTQKMAEEEKADIEERILQLADDLASAISRLDIYGVKNLFSERDGTKYISHGVVIPYQQLEGTLGQYYGTLKKMNFVNEKKEVRVIDSNATVLTTWVSYTVVTKDDKEMEERAIFTSVYIYQNGEWKIFQAHKSLIR